jgi:hypothetical protein
MKRKLSIAVLITALLVATACSFPLISSSSEEAVSNAVAATVQAALQQTKAAATYTPLPTLTPYPTYTPASQYVPPTPPRYPVVQPQACNAAQFVRETVKDNTVFEPGETFTKTWRLKNVGTCTWNTGYDFVFASGDRMSGAKVTDLDQRVRPGEYVDLEVDLKAPSSPDTYTGYWKLRSDDGYDFAQVYVQIKVKKAFAVKSVDLSADPSSYSGDCSSAITFDISADITSSAAGKVTYYWERSDGLNTSTKSVTFDSSGTKTVTYEWQIDTPVTDTYSISLYVDSPNHQEFGPLDIPVECTAP